MMVSQLDFFASAVAPTAAKAARARVGVRGGQAETDLDEEAMARHLEATGSYRVLRELLPREIVKDARPGFPRQAIILDTKTTGLNHRSDEIIEIGVIAFTFDDTMAGFSSRLLPFRPKSHA